MCTNVISDRNEHNKFDSLGLCIEQEMKSQNVKRKYIYTVGVHCVSLSPFTAPCLVGLCNTSDLLLLVLKV